MRAELISLILIVESNSRLTLEHRRFAIVGNPVMQAVSSGGPTSQCDHVHTIRKKIRQMMCEGFELSLVWLAGHKGILGHVPADTRAKLTTPFLPLPTKTKVGNLG